MKELDRLARECGVTQARVRYIISANGKPLGLGNIRDRDEAERLVAFLRTTSDFRGKRLTIRASK